ncbi:response regulator [Dokdonia sinensis]|uniref:histidine kinase n=1 Tax=Dokdonia sinensis TaxID=2479847 RepID=A0A3M0GFC8_9FLAO|nr:ATP-binding protein [Dokdonia sinensis]RMB63430.1 response regulator [Dokdonia sinensis]
MIEELRKDFVKNTTQIIVSDTESRVLQSDNNILSIPTGNYLTSVHPFFYTISNLLEEPLDENYFYCVQIENLGKNYFFDIKTKIYRKSGQVALFLIDFTEHYKSVHKIKQARNESIIDFNIAQELNNELQVQRGFKNKFLANVSHEIRTPLNSIVGFIQVLQNTGLNREQLDLVNIVKSSSENLKSIVNDLLDISKIEAGRLEIKNKRFNLHLLLDELVKAHQIQAEEKRITFQFERGESLPRFIVLDRLRLNQVLVNLLDNAIKYTQVGNITFSVTTPSKNRRKIPIVFEVKDTGIGIDAENVTTIFESFTQLEKRGLFGGTGLGLSIVKQLSELMEGKIEVESVKGKGSIFRFTVEAGVSHDQKAEKKLRSRTSKSKESKNSKYRVLLGEDIEVNQLLLMRIFADHPDYSLDIAKNGEHVLKLLDHYKYDLILMDLTMPIMDGFDATARIRNHKNKHISKIPIIALSARCSDEDIEESKEVGMNGYLIKPIDERELFQTMEKLIQRYKRKGQGVS